MKTVVTKFGGSSLASAGQFEKVKKIIMADEARKYVVPSAPGKRDKKDTKITDLLYMCQSHVEIGISIEDVFKYVYDRYTGIVKELGLNFEIENIAFIGQNEKLKNVERAVIPGFYGADKDGNIVTFSRGGSDVTGALVAASLNADLYENWTDVSGFLMADPRIVENPKAIDEITYKELRELSYMGASVLHEDAIFPVRESGIPINIKNTNKPEDKGTFIVSETKDDETKVLTGIAGKKDFTVISIEKAMMNSEMGFCRKVLGVLEMNGVSFENMPSEKIVEEIKRTCNPDSVIVHPNMALIATVGKGMARKKGVAATVFTALSEAGVNVRMIDQGSSEMNILVGIENDDFEKGIKAIYKAFN